MPDQPQQPKQIGGGRRAIGDVAPKLVELTETFSSETSGAAQSSPPATAA